MEELKMKIKNLRNLNIAIKWKGKRYEFAPYETRDLDDVVAGAVIENSENFERGE